MSKKPKQNKQNDAENPVKNEDKATAASTAEQTAANTANTAEQKAKIDEQKEAAFIKKAKKIAKQAEAKIEKKIFAKISANKRRIKKVLFWFFSIVIILLLALELTLRYCLPLESVKTRITSFISAKTGAEVSLNKISAGLFGFTINGLDFKVNQTSLASIENGRVRLSLFSLLHGQIKIKEVKFNGIAINIARDKDGVFNFAPVLQALTSPDDNTPKKQDNNNTFDTINLVVKNLQLNNVNINYSDQMLGLTAAVKDLFFEVPSFNFKKPFRVSSTLDISANYQDKYKIDRLPIGFTVYPDFARGNLDNASLGIRLFTFNLGPASFVLQGNISGFVNPTLQLSMQGDNLTQDMFSGIAALPPFRLETMSLDTIASLNPSKSEFTLNNLVVNFLSSTFSAAGNLNYGAKTPQFNLNLSAALLLDRFSELGDIVAQYKPTGKINTNLSLTNTKAEGNILLDRLGGYYSQAGDFSDINSEIKIADYDKIDMPTLSGKLNGLPFNTGAAYFDRDGYADVFLFFKADKVLAKREGEQTPPEVDGTTADDSIDSDAAANTNADAENSEATTSDGQEDITLAPKVDRSKLKNWPLPPLNIKIDVDVKNLNAPFIFGNDITLKVNLKGVTPALDKTSGTLALQTSNGEIRDLYRLTNANAITKALFLSLGIVSKVINTLNVLDVLGSIKDSVLPKGDKATEAEANAQTHDQLGGTLVYDSFITSLNFAKGISEIKEGAFVSEKISFRLNGNVDFNTRAINMQVNAAPGKVSDGIMPIALNIGGTVDEPEGSMSMLSSAASLLSDSIFKSPVSNAIKKGFGSIFGGSKKEVEKEAKDAAKDESSSEQAEPVYIPVNTTALQESIKKEEEKAASKAGK